jgi:GTP-binding protein
MFKRQQFVRSVYSLDQIPKLRLPEVVLCGRSNVGKSSFINSLFNRKNLAKVSSTPGKTRSINYYSIDDVFYIVDLPGYGFAKASVEERKRWKKLIERFFFESAYINLVFHLIDCRHLPSELDVEMNKLLKSCKLPYIFVLNKADKIKLSEQKKFFAEFNKIFPESILSENTIFYSSYSKVGKKEITSLLHQSFYKNSE